MCNSWQTWEWMLIGFRSLGPVFSRVRNLLIVMQYIWIWNFHESFPSIVCVDGTGTVNQAGVDHYNRVINALLAKGVLLMMISFDQMFFKMKVNFLMSIICRNWTICDTLSLGFASSFGRQVQWMAWFSDNVFLLFVLSCFFSLKKVWGISVELQSNMCFGLIDHLQKWFRKLCRDML